MELVVRPEALRAAARALTRTGGALSTSCGHADATMSAGCASLDGAAAGHIGVGWSRLSRAVADLAVGYERVGDVLQVLADAYAEVDGTVVPGGGGAR